MKNTGLTARVSQKIGYFIRQVSSKSLEPYISWLKRSTIIVCSILLLTYMFGLISTIPNHLINWKSIEINNFPSNDFPNITALELGLDNNTLIAGTSRNGILRSTNQGNSWFLSNQGLTGNGVRKILVNQKHNLVFTATDDGLFQSQDNGQSWIALDDDLPNNSYIRDVIIGPNGEDIFVTLLDASGGENITKTFRSEDDGKTWKIVSDEKSSDVPVYLTALNDGKTIFAASSSINGDKPYKSEDNGHSWQPLNLPIGVVFYEFFHVSLDNKSLVFANSYVNVQSPSGSSVGPIYFVDPDGINHQPLHIGSEGDSLHAITVMPDKRTIIAVVGYELYQSRDGLEWLHIEQFHGRPLDSIGFLIAEPKTGNLIAATYSSGMYRSSDSGLNWIDINNGIQFKSIQKTLTKDGFTFVETWSGALYFSKDQGRSWKALPYLPGVSAIKNLSADGGDPHQIVVSDYNNNIFLVSLVENELKIQREFRLDELSVDDHVFLPEMGIGFLLSRKQSSEPTQILQLDMNTGRILSQDTVSFPDQNTAFIDRIFNIGQDLYLSSSGTYQQASELPLYRSTDLGKTWQPLSSGSFAGLDSLMQSSVGQRMLAIIRLKNDPSVPRLAYSDDQGVTWNLGDHELTGIEFTQLAVSPDHKGLIASSANRGIYISQDNGLSWMPANQGLSSYENIQTLTVDHTNKTIFIGTLRGLFRSTDFAKSWHAVDRDIIDMDISGIVENIDGTLYASSKGYVASSKDYGRTWKKIGKLTSYGSVALALIPETNLLVAKRSGSGGSMIYFFDTKKELWLDLSYASRPDRVCSYDCELSISPDGESLWLVDNDRSIYVFDTHHLSWKRIVTLNVLGRYPTFVFQTSIDPTGKSLLISDSEGLYKVDLRSYSGTMLDDYSIGDKYIVTELPESLWGLGVRGSVNKGQLSIGRPGMGWLAILKYINYPPMSIAIHDDQLSLYSTSGSNILLSSEEPLPFIWSAPTLYISLIARTWYTIDQLSINPASYLLGVPLLIMGVFTMILVNANYRRFKRRFEASNHLEQLILLSSPAYSKWDFEQLIERLRLYTVVSERNQIMRALGELSKRDLILNKQQSFKAAEPIITTIYQAVSPENTLDSLVEQVRHEHPLVITTEQFLKKAGFHSFVQSGYGTLCSSDLPIWKDVSPLYMHIVAENELTLMEFTEVMKAVENAFHGDSPGHTVLIVLDQPPRASDLFQIFAQKAQRGFNIVPISSSLINLAQMEDSVIETLREQIDTYIGRADLYDVRSSVSDVLSFFGRSSTLADTQKQLLSGRSVVIFGVRKVGKSSLMNRIKEESDWLVAFLDLQGYSGGLKYCYDDILQRWVNAYHVRFPNESILRDAVKTANLSSTERIRVLRTYIENLFASLATQNERVGLLLFLDEMDTLLEQPEYLEFASTFRSLAEDPRWQGRFAILAAGLDPAINRLDRFNNGRNPFFQFFSESPIGPLSNEDTKTMIVSVGGQMGFAFDQQFLDLIAYMSGGHPFVARQLCSQATRNLERPVRVPVHQATLAIEAYLASARSYLSESLWAVDSGGPPSEEALLLKALAKDDIQTEGQLISTKLAHKKRRLLQLALDRLADMSLIKQIDSCWTITIPIYRAWIRQMILGLSREE